MKDVIESVKETIEEGIKKVEEIAEEIMGDKKTKSSKKKSEKKTKSKEIKKSKKEKEEKIPEKELAEAAEAESLATEVSEEKRKKILEKAKELVKKIEKTETEELKEKIKKKKKEPTLLPLEEYVKSGIYLGTKVVTPNMRQYVYRRRADGIAILNTDIIDEKLKEGIKFVSNFNTKDIIVVCKRQVGWKVVEMFSKITGIRAFTKKYPAGILTNIQLPDFFEVEMAIICDSWLDRNALEDIKRTHKKVLMIADTNNFTKSADQIIIGNNKSNKSLGLIFYLLTKGYCEAKGIKADIPPLEWWIEEREEKERGAKFGV